MNLYKFVSEEINAALNMQVALEIPKNRDFGDFATNAAMIAAKAQEGAGSDKTGQSSNSHRKSPRQIAEEILPKIAALPFVAEASIAGPGFINIKIKDEVILKESFAPAPATADAAQGPQDAHNVIDLDYGAYNVAKSFHIGHLRTGIVGDSFNRIARALGYKTFSWNHIGDWGRPMALVIAWILKHKIDLDKVSEDEFNTFYPNASALSKTDTEFMDYAHKIKAEFQKGNPEFFSIYEKFLPISMNMMAEVVRKLNMMPFDYNWGERNAAKYLPEVEKILREKDLLQKSDGAEIVILKKEGDNAPMPPFMWTDSRGADTYDATDLAALYCRKITDNPDQVIYFTDSRQKLHFQQLFRVSEMTGIEPAEKLEHVEFGTINGADGRPYKTRDGAVAGLLDMIETANEAVRARVAESGKELPAEIIEMIALAALKFNDLMHDVKSDYVFDPAQITQFEGKTGPYILYTAVRLKSVLHKAAHAPSEGGYMPPLATEERNLLLAALDFERTLQSAFKRRDTSLLANYTYDLAQLCNTFYHNCPILGDARRLRITQTALDILSKAIELLGLKIPDEM